MVAEGMNKVPAILVSSNKSVTRQISFSVYDKTKTTEEEQLFLRTAKVEAGETKGQLQGRKIYQIW